MTLYRKSTLPKSVKTIHVGMHSHHQKTLPQYRDVGAGPAGVAAAGLKFGTLTEKKCSQAHAASESHAHFTY